MWCVRCRVSWRGAALLSSCTAVIIVGCVAPQAGAQGLLSARGRALSPPRGGWRRRTATSLACPIAPPSHAQHWRTHTHTQSRPAPHTDVRRHTLTHTPHPRPTVHGPRERPGGRRGDTVTARGGGRSGLVHVSTGGPAGHHEPRTTSPAAGAALRHTRSLGWHMHDQATGARRQYRRAPHCISAHNERTAKSWIHGVGDRIARARRVGCSRVSDGAGLHRHHLEPREAVVLDARRKKPQE